MFTVLRKAVDNTTRWTYADLIRELDARPGTSYRIDTTKKYLRIAVPSDTDNENGIFLPRALVHDFERAKAQIEDTLKMHAPVKEYAEAMRAQLGACKYIALQRERGDTFSHADQRASLQRVVAIAEVFNPPRASTEMALRFLRHANCILEMQYAFGTADAIARVTRPFTIAELEDWSIHLMTKSDFFTYQHWELLQDIESRIVSLKNKT